MCVCANTCLGFRLVWLVHWKSQIDDLYCNKYYSYLTTSVALSENKEKIESTKTLRRYVLREG
jgi:hypothetical protein